tara:strand:+ start:1030 stop:2091 length:1062 start_codon:yes stop_codon:yes gene_type:complete
MYRSENIKKASYNLLINCAKLSSEKKLLIIYEDQKYGWYSKDVVEVIYTEAKNLGINTVLLEVGEPNNESKDRWKDIIDAYDCTIFFARLGDQGRFENNFFNSKRVMSYVKNTESLLSSFGSTNYYAMQEIKEIINTLLIKSDHIEITCPLGTKVSGRINKNQFIKNNDVTLLRFPIVVASPILADHFSGKILLTNYLTSTGSKVYKPNYIKLKEPVIVNVENGKIVNFSGDIQTIKKIEDHYSQIANTFDIDKNIVHSWHSGIHPGLTFKESIAQNPEKWSNTIFASPSNLHFHTCGNYAPGEICWNILNHSVKIDGIPIWEDGVLKVESFKETLDCIEKWQDLKYLYNLNV